MRALSKVMLMCKEGQVSDMQVWAMKRAKKFWSQEVTVENSITLNPTRQTFSAQTNLLEQCVRAADYEEKAYFDPHSTVLNSESLVSWANECTTGRAPQVWSVISNMLLSRGEQAAKFASMRSLTKQVGVSKLMHDACSTVKTYRDIRASVVTQLRSTKKVAPAPVFVKNQYNEMLQVCAWSKCKVELWSQTDDGITRSEGTTTFACSMDHYNKAKKQVETELSQLLCSPIQPRFSDASKRSK